MEKINKRYFVTRVYDPVIDDGEYCMESPDDWFVRLRFGRIFAKVFRDVNIMDCKSMRKRFQEDLSKNYKTLGEIFANENVTTSLLHHSLYAFGFLNYIRWQGKLMAIAGFDIELFDDKFVVKEWKKGGDESAKPIEELMQPKYQKRYQKAMYKRFGIKYLIHLRRLKKLEQAEKDTQTTKPIQENFEIEK